MMTTDEAIQILEREFYECKDTLSVYANRRRMAYEKAINALYLVDAFDEFIDNEAKKYKNSNSAASSHYLNGLEIIKKTIEEEMQNDQ